jgi:hypothetical protein
MKPKLYGKYSSIKHGNRGQVVHLPMSFIKMNNIKPGTQLSIYLFEDDTNHLLVQAPKKKEKS